MMKKSVLLAVLVIAMALVASRPASAGCCVIASLDSLPGNVVAGEPVSLGFTVHYFGEKPNYLKPEVIATEVVGRGSVRTVSLSDGVPGHYVATLVFPSAGDWRWTITPWDNGEPQIMPRLTVTSEPVVLTAAFTVQDASSAWKMVALASGLAAAASFVLAGAVAFRRESLPSLIRGR